MRLVQGDDRVSDARTERRAQARVGDFSTGGSRGIRESHEYVRKGGAAARIMLVQAAADAWKVPAAECSAANSVVTHSPSGRKTTYGKVAEAAAKLAPPADVPLKDPKSLKLIGKSVKRLDTIDKLTGKQVYGADLKLPGMLNAAIKECPVFGGKVTSFDAAKVSSMKGVRKVVQVGDSAVAVVADTLVAHAMETGFRRTHLGAMVPRDIIRLFVCTYNGVEIFRAELHPAISANPYIAFSTVATESGIIAFRWSGDNGFAATESASITVV